MFLAALLPLFSYRYYVNLHATPRYHPGYYLGIAAIVDNIKIMGEMAWMGIFEAFRLFWLLPLGACYLLARSRKYPELSWMLLVFTSCCAQMVLASDTSRLMGLAFPMILFAIKVVHDEYGDALTEKILYAVFAANFIVPVYYVGQKTLYPFLPLPISLLLEYVRGIRRLAFPVGLRARILER